MKDSTPQKIKFPLSISLGNANKSTFPADVQCYHWLSITNNSIYNDHVSSYCKYCSFYHQYLHISSGIRVSVISIITILI